MVALIRDMAAFIDCDHRELVFLPNVTTAISTILFSLDLSSCEGDPPAEVLMLDIGYGSVKKAAQEACAQAQATLVQANVELPLPEECAPPPRCTIILLPLELRPESTIAAHETAVSCRAGEPHRDRRNVSDTPGEPRRRATPAPHHRRRLLTRVPHPCPAPAPIPAAVTPRSLYPAAHAPRSGTPRVQRTPQRPFTFSSLPGWPTADPRAHGRRPPPHAPCMLQGG